MIKPHIWLIAIYPCLVKSTRIPTKANEGISPNNVEISDNWRRTRKDITQLKLDMENIKKVCEGVCWIRSSFISFSVLFQYFVLDIFLLLNGINIWDDMTLNPVIRAYSVRVFYIKTKFYYKLKVTNYKQTSIDLCYTGTFKHLSFFILCVFIYSTSIIRC